MMPITGHIIINDVQITLQPYSNHSNNSILGRVTITQDVVSGCSKADVLQYCKTNNCLTLHVVGDLNLYGLMTPVEIAGLLKKDE